MAKSKYKEIYCTYCKRASKMLILQEIVDNKGWFECSRCHHSFYIDLNSLEDEKKSDRKDKEPPSKDDCINYTPDISYEVGSFIYHSEWDDIGRVEAKRRLSDGKLAIIVKFKNSGSKTLIENLKHEEEEEEVKLGSTEFQHDPIDIDVEVEAVIPDEIIEKDINKREISLEELREKEDEPTEETNFEN